MQIRLTRLILLALTLLLPVTENARGARRLGHGASVAAKEAELSKAFEAKGLKLGSPVFIRVYKKSSEMELWVEKGAHYVHYKTYGICRWSGGLGPKYYEGDRQSPEGLYRITSADLIVNARWDRAMNINYPNTFDVMNGRSGSSILIHGKCGSIGCFAIQDQNVEEVYAAVRAALHEGQAYVPVLSLPFRFTSLAPAKSDTLNMNEFWSDLRRADLLFERDKLPPAAWICDGRYYFADRRGDSHRHAVHTPGCHLLDEPVQGRVASHKTSAPPDKVNVAAAVPAKGPEKAVETASKGCGAKKSNCKLLHVALKRAPACAGKYSRCRSAAYHRTKRMHSASRSASKRGRAIRTRRGHRSV